MLRKPARPEVELQVDTLVGEGLLIRKGDAMELTEQGQDVHARLASVQQSVRRKVMNGIAQSDYVVALQALKTIVANLER